ILMPRRHETRYRSVLLADDGVERKTDRKAADPDLGRFARDAREYAQTLRVSCLDDRNAILYLGGDGPLRLGREMPFDGSHEGVGVEGAAQYDSRASGPLELVVTALH